MTINLKGESQIFQDKTPITKDQPIQN